MNRFIACCGLNCGGCRIDGVKTPYCDALCPIRQCALGKKMETCGDHPRCIGWVSLGRVLSQKPDDVKAEI